MTLILTVTVSPPEIGPWRDGDGAVGLMFSANGDKLAAWDRAGSISVWAVGSGTRLGVVTARKDSKIDPVFSPDGVHLLLYDTTGTVQCWDIVQGTSWPLDHKQLQFSEVEALRTHTGVLRGCF